MSIPQQLSAEDHVRQRGSMYIGALEQQPINLWVYEGGRFRRDTLLFAPGLYKIFDEIIVNAIDHFVKFSCEVTAISIALDEDTGMITVLNNGRGFNLRDKAMDEHGTEMWSPELCAGHLRSGTNYDDSQQRVVGGMNGIGMKATNLFSASFILQTADGDLSFAQEFSDQMRERSAPQVRQLEKPRRFTRISFIPAFGCFGAEWGAALHSTLQKLLITRAVHAAVFTGIKVAFNETVFNRITFAEFCRMYVDRTVAVELKDETNANGGYAMWIGVGLSPGAEFEHVSIVNGIFVYDGGNHVNYFRSACAAALRPFILKELRLERIAPAQIYKHLFICLVGSVVNPTFSSQSKEKLTGNSDQFKGYRLPAAFVEKCWKQIGHELLDRIAVRPVAKQEKPSLKRLLTIEHYEPARASKNLTESSLCIVEGVSAMGGLLNAISEHKITNVSPDRYGVFAIKGVPINARKESAETKAAGLKQSRKLEDNSRFSDLLLVTGLQYSDSYDMTPEGQKQFNRLRYGRIILIADQDMDGHNICGLVLSNILLFWPRLITRGFIKKLNTPLIHAYIGKTPFSFYTMQEFQQWKASHPKCSSVKYSKGLGSNSTKESTRMFTDIAQKLIKLHGDEDIHEHLEHYYGKDTNIRKDILASPSRLGEIELESTASHFVCTYVHDSQRYNISRKLPSVFDGHITARRKAIFVARHYMGPRPMKVVQVTGSVMERANYHHGEAPMHETIIRMAQTFTGGRVLPYFLPDGNVGSYKMGGRDMAQARYVAVAKNKKLLDAVFPPAMDRVLEFTVEENHTYEPSTYYSIIPMCIMEFIQIPATAWSVRVFPRHYKSVFKNLRGMITGAIEYPAPMRIYNYNGSVIHMDGTRELASEGVWKWDPKQDTVTITTMPLYVYPSVYAKLKAEDEANDAYNNQKYHRSKPMDNSTNEATELIFYLRKGAYEKIREKYPGPNWVAEFFQLRRTLQPNLNFIDRDGSVISFKTYEEVMKYWFDGTKKMYEKRMVWHRAMLRMQILRLDNIIRFIESHEKYDIKTRSEEEMDAILSADGFVQLNNAFVLNPSAPAEEIEWRCTGDGASFEYLYAISFRGVMRNGHEKRVAERAALQEQLNEIMDDFEEGFIGRKTWLREVDALYEILNEGIPRQWAGE